VILIDANILIYAHVSSFTHHKIARDWLDRQLRLLVSPGLERPEPIADAWQQVRVWLAAETAWIPQPTERHADVLSEFVALPGIHGSLVPGASGCVSG
jgi:uncharacterized protein